jgi:hypothetical protein
LLSHRLGNFQGANLLRRHVEDVDAKEDLSRRQIKLNMEAGRLLRKLRNLILRAQRFRITPYYCGFDSPLAGSPDPDAAESVRIFVVAAKRWYPVNKVSFNDCVATLPDAA